MKQTKRLLALLLSAALCVSFAACSSDTGETVIDSAEESTSVENTSNENETDSDEVVLGTSLSITDDGTVGTLTVTGDAVNDFIALKESGEECAFFVNLCNSAEEPLYTFCLDVLSDGWSYRMDDESAGESYDANGTIGDGVIAFSFEVGALDLAELKSIYFFHFDDNDEYYFGAYFDVSEITVSLSGASSASDDDENPVNDNMDDDSSWAGPYIASSYEGAQMRASKEITLTENTITFSYDDIEYVLAYDINALVTASELSNYEYGENNAAYASSNDKDYIIIFSDSDKRRIQIYDITLLASQNYLGDVLTYEENLNPDFDPAAEDWVGTYYDYMNNELTITQSQITIDFDKDSYMSDYGDSFTFAYDLASLQSSAIIGEDTANCLPVMVDGQDFIVCFEAPDSLCLYVYDPLGYAYTSTTFNKD